MWLFFWSAVVCVTIGFFQNEFVDQVFDHQEKAEDPEYIHDDVVSVLQTVTKQRPPEEDDVLHVVEEEDPDAVDLF